MNAVRKRLVPFLAAIAMLAAAASLIGTIPASAASGSASHPAGRALTAAAATVHRPPGVHPAKVVAGPDTDGKFTNFVTQDNVNMRSGPGTSYTIVGTVALTTEGIADYCWEPGTGVSGYPNWDVVFDPYNLRVGFVSESLLSNLSQETHC
jgi:hypothetical protein